MGPISNCLPPSSDINRRRPSAKQSSPCHLSDETCSESVSQRPQGPSKFNTQSPSPGRAIASPAGIPTGHAALQTLARRIVALCDADQWIMGCMGMRYDTLPVRSPLPSLVHMLHLNQQESKDTRPTTLQSTPTSRPCPCPCPILLQIYAKDGSPPLPTCACLASGVIIALLICQYLNFAIRLSLGKERLPNTTLPFLPLLSSIYFLYSLLLPRYSRQRPRRSCCSLSVLPFLLQLPSRSPGSHKSTSALPCTGLLSRCSKICPEPLNSRPPVSSSFHISNHSPALLLENRDGTV